MNGIQLTSTGYAIRNPQFKVSGDKIYYAWIDWVSPHYQLWTGISNLDGSNFVATQRTFDAHDKDNVQFQVVGSIIYYVFEYYVGSYYQIATAQMNTDGSGFSLLVQTSWSDHNSAPQLEVVGSTIYYIFLRRFSYGYDRYSKIFTAFMNTDGTGWTETQQTTANYSYDSVHLAVDIDNNKIHYSFYMSSSISFYTAETALDGSGWLETYRCNGGTLDMKLYNNKLYYVILNSNNIYTATMDTDGLNWNSIRQTFGTTFKSYPKLYVHSSYISYVYEQQIDNTLVTATTNLDGSNWIETRNIVGVNRKTKTQICDNYFIWLESDGSHSQIWLGIGEISTTSNISVNVSDVWYYTIPYINVSGVWKELTASGNVSNVWK